jgi:hypothetical protein
MTEAKTLGAANFVRSDFIVLQGYEMITSLRAAFALLAVFVAASFAPAAAQTPSPEGAKVYFINLKDGAEVDSPFLVQFGLSGMGVAPAGVEKPNTGHHHLLIDATLSPEQLKEPIPVDDNHRHFGGGQTEAMVTLPKGQHTLQLVLGDWSHIPHVPPVMSEPITITVR